MPGVRRKWMKLEKLWMNEMMIKLLMGAAALVCIGLMIRGVMLMARSGAADEDTLWLHALVRQVKPLGLFASRATLTLNVDDVVLHVECTLPGRKWRAADLVEVQWRKGEQEAVALSTIRSGQTMLVLGFAALALVAVAYVILF